MSHTREEKIEAFGRFIDILDILREKCPWDHKQTNESLRPNTIEERTTKPLKKSWEMYCYTSLSMLK